MAQHNMRLQLTSGTSLTWVDPNDFRSTFRINLNVNQKVAGAVSVYNARSEVITNRAPLVVIEGCTDACSVNRENISIRTTISGSVENKAAVLAALLDHLHNLGLARDDLVAGLLPTTIQPVVEYTGS